MNNTRETRRRIAIQQSFLQDSSLQVEVQQEDEDEERSSRYEEKEESKITQMCIQTLNNIQVNWIDFWKQFKIHPEQDFDVNNNNNRDVINHHSSRQRQMGVDYDTDSDSDSNEENEIVV